MHWAGSWASSPLCFSQSLLSCQDAFFWLLLDYGHYGVERVHAIFSVAVFTKTQEEAEELTEQSR